MYIRFSGGVCKTQVAPGRINFYLSKKDINYVDAPPPPAHAHILHKAVELLVLFEGDPTIISNNSNSHFEVSLEGVVRGLMS